MALAESGPSAGPPTLAEGGGSKDALAAPLEAAAAGTAALVAGGQSIPLTHALAAPAGGSTVSASSAVGCRVATQSGSAAAASRRTTRT